MKISLFYKYSTIITLLLFCTCIDSALGQKTLIFPLDTEGGNLRSFSTVNYDLPNKANFEQIQKASFLPITQEFQGHQTIWIRFALNNVLEKDTLIRFLFENPASLIEVFRKDDNHLVSIGRTGSRYPTPQMTFLCKFASLSISLRGQGIDTFYVCSFDHSAHVRNSPIPGIYDGLTLPEHVLIEHFNHYEIERWFYFFMAGFSFLMAFWAFFKSAVNRWDKPNLYCGLMFVCHFCNACIWTRTVHLNHSVLFSDIPTLYSMGTWFLHLTPIFMWLVYRSFLNLRIERPFLYRFVTICIWILWILTIPHIFLSVRAYSTNTLNETLLMEKIFEVTLFILQVVMSVLFVSYLRHPIYRYIVLSNWIGILIFILFLLTFRMGLILYFPIWFSPMFVAALPLVIDGILFMIALTLRDRQTVTENMRLQQQNIANELKALRSQMNPHFIFNCLNAIKSYTLNHDTEGADFYLTKFSKLIRQVLENSRSEKITLNNELETLKLYMDMEKLRAGDKFNYDIKLSDDIETDFIEVPPMLIQPYVENAIWHGLMHKEGTGHISIILNQKDNKYLTINIIDNGVGREQSSILKSKTATRHKSFGMKITSERMDIIRDMYKIKTTLLIEDLKNADGSAAGTKVTLEIPL